MSTETAARLVPRDDPARTMARDVAARTAEQHPTSLDEHLVSFVAPTSFEADQYRTLRHVVERLRKDSDIGVLAVTSPGPGEGKTLTTLNLAGALAQAQDARVLVLDADFRRPAVARYLGLANIGAPGLVDLIADPRRELAEAVRDLDSGNLSVVPAGAVQQGFYELLTSPRLGAVIGEARRQYDYVLVDTPPVVALPDCRLLAKWIDGFLVLVTTDKTPRKQLAETLNLLDPEKVIGLIFNGVRRSSSRYYGYYSYYHQSGR